MMGQGPQSGRENFAELTIPKDKVILSRGDEYSYAVEAEDQNCQMSPNLNSAEFSSPP